MVFSNVNGKIWFFLNIVFTSMLLSTDQFLYFSLSFRGDPICCTFVYAKCSYVQRCALWYDISSFYVSMTLSWIVSCDFNVVIDSSKCSKILPSLLPYSEFSDMISGRGI